MITVLGGTFSRLHKGHKLMIKAAFETGNKVVIGLTTDEYLKHNKAYRGYSYSLRKRVLKRYMSRFGGEFEILPLGTRAGNTEINPEYEAIVVSRETEESAKSINEKRKKNGLSPMKVVTVPMVLAEDLFPMSSTRIISGEIRTSGNRVKPVRIGIATGNELKRRSLERYLHRIMKNFVVEIKADYFLDTDQPFGHDTSRLAVKRAMESLNDRDYGIGIESGVYRDPITGKYIEHHFCAVLDRYSRLTVGTSSGFELPENMISLMKEGREESEAYSILHGVQEIGKQGGVIGAFSKGSLNRGDLIGECIRNAFVPRIAAEFFGLDRKL